MRQSKAEIYLHFVWAAKGRQCLITDDIERFVHRCITGEAVKLGCKVLAMGGMPDHIHLLVTLPAKLSPAALMNQVKGVSSRVVVDELEGHEGFGW